MPPQRHALVAHLSKPPKTKRGRTRQFMGVSWSATAPDNQTSTQQSSSSGIGCGGVEVRHTFVGLPSCGRLCGGDIIMRVCNEPVNTPEDVVYHWHNAPSGTDVRFDVMRSETHVFAVTSAALAELNLVFSTSETFQLPVITSMNPVTEERLRMLQVQGVPTTGDLVVSIDGMAVATSAAASAALAALQQQPPPPNQPSDGVVEIAVKRDWPEPREGEVAQDFYCCCIPNSGLTRVEKPRRLPPNRGRNGTALAEMAPPLLDDARQTVAGEAMEG
jgi:hypothetical protein